MKTIATINFKGGVGKTTVTWCLADILANYGNSAKILVFDLDAQMSLTQAFALNEGIGTTVREHGFRFVEWRDKCKANKKTIYDALKEFSRSTNLDFNFDIEHDFIYKITDNLHFVPSVEDLYWLWTEDTLNRMVGENFIKCLLEKIEHTNNYDYVLFDCPPSFTLLSYSVLSVCDLLIIPINPDFFAAKGIGLFVSTLRSRIRLVSMPKIGVFMNKAVQRNGIVHQKRNTIGMRLLMFVERLNNAIRN